MNYNANGTNRPTLGRKIKRVSDVNAMGYNPVPPSNLYPNLNPDNSPLNQQEFIQATQQSFTSVNQGYEIPPYTQPQQQQFPNKSFTNIPPQFGVFGPSLVQDVALQYGQQLTSSGTTILKQEVEKYVPVTSLKYYFAVDTKYVLTKLLLLFFPFTHKDWSIKYEQDGPVQPRFEINAPDLYIPSMAYVTYVLISGMMLGMQQRFSPEQIGILASSAMAWLIVELAIYSCTLYIANIKTSIRTFDLLAYSGYKFVGIIISILSSLLVGNTGYYIALMYINFALAFFLIRTLKAQVLIGNNSQTTAQYYGNEIPPIGSKRRLYFLLFIAGIQPILSWWLSFHLIANTVSIEKTV